MADRPLEELSDEEIAALPLPENEEAPAEDETNNQAPDSEDDGATDNEETQDGDNDENLSDGEPEGDASESEDENDEGDSEVEGTSDTDDEPDPEEAASGSDVTGQKASQDEPDDDGDDISSDEGDKPKSEKVDNSVNYKAEYTKLTAPFTANGKQIQVDNVDQAIRLMQMGAGYNQKMVQLKPALQVVKMLEKNNLMDPEKLNYLIDLHNLDEGAVKKLLKDSKLDPLDLDVEKDTGYKPKDHRQDPKVTAVEEVVEQLRETPTGNDTLKAITDTWDSASKDALFEQPQFLSVLNDQMANGIYAKIMGEVDKQKALGNLIGVSDLQAYMQVGKHMNDQGLLTDQPDNGNPTSQSTPGDSVPVTTNNQESKLREKRRAAASASAKPSAKPKKAPVNKDWLAMSDDEIAKMPDP